MFDLVLDGSRSAFATSYNVILSSKGIFSIAAEVIVLLLNKFKD
jgi:hypothetical protein